MFFIMYFELAVPLKYSKQNLYAYLFLMKGGGTPPGEDVAE